MNYIYHKKWALEIALEAIKQGFTVYFAKKGTYGFFTDNEGKRLVSFDVSGLRPGFSGNYKSLKCGTGWRLDSDNIEQAWLESQCPPLWATSGEKVKLTTVEEHLKRYHPSSRYRILEPLKIGQKVKTAHGLGEIAGIEYFDENGNSKLSVVLKGLYIESRYAIKLDAGHTWPSEGLYFEYLYNFEVMV